MTSLRCGSQLGYQFLKQSHTQFMRTCKRDLYSAKKGVSRDFVAFLQQPIDLSLPSIQRWMKKMGWEALKREHGFDAKRLKSLGGELAAAHFVVGKGGAVKFVGSDRWFEKEKSGTYYLPNTKQTNMFVEAVDASNTKMLYESFDTLFMMKKIQYLNLSGCKYIDDWCLGRLHHFRDSLLQLDLSGCPNITERGLFSLHKLRTLRRLNLGNLPHINNVEIVGLMIEEAVPGCLVEGVDFSKISELQEGSASSSQLLADGDTDSVDENFVAAYDMRNKSQDSHSGARTDECSTIKSSQQQ